MIYEERCVARIVILVIFINVIIACLGADLLSDISEW